MTAPQDPNITPVLSYHTVRPGRGRSLQSAVARGLDFSGAIYLLVALVMGIGCIFACIQREPIPWFGLTIAAIFLIVGAMFIVCRVCINRGSSTAALMAIVLASLQLAMLFAMFFLFSWSTWNWTASLCSLFALSVPGTLLIIHFNDAVQLFRTWRSPSPN